MHNWLNLIIILNMEENFRRKIKNDVIVLSFFFGSFCKETGEFYIRVILHFFQKNEVYRYF